jgi:hypothetical protein
MNTVKLFEGANFDGNLNNMALQAQIWNIKIKNKVNCIIYSAEIKGEQKDQNLKISAYCCWNKQSQLASVG